MISERADSVAICAHEVALCDFGENAFQRTPLVDEGADGRDLFAAAMVEIHNVVRKRLLAVGAGLALEVCDDCADAGAFCGASRQALWQVPFRGFGLPCLDFRRLAPMLGRFVVGTGGSAVRFGTRATGFVGSAVAGFFAFASFVQGLCRQVRSVYMWSAVTVAYRSAALKLNPA